MALLRPDQALRSGRRRDGLKQTKLTGYVVDNEDPEKRQRVRIRIPQLHAGIPDDKLPWVTRRAEGQHNSGGGVGDVRVPQKGAKVFSTFDDGDPHNSYYGNSPTTDDVNKENKILEDDYPHTYGSVDHYGNKTTVNTKTGVVNFTHKSGASTTYDGSGNVSIVSPGNVTISAKGDLVIVAGGKMQVHASGDLSLKGARIDENGSDGAASAVEPSVQQTPNIPQKSGQNDIS